MRRLTIIIALALTVAGCGRKAPVTDTKGEPRKKPTSIKEIPYMLEGDYTPETGIPYKVIIDDDTCFVVVESIDDEQLHGYYYQLNGNSNIVERKEFSYDKHWKEKRQEALVYQYKPEDYNSLADGRYKDEIYSVVERKDIEYGQALGYWTSMPGTDTLSYLEILSDGFGNGIIKETTSLTMDIYMPDNNDRARPMVLMLHGGAYYVGDKSDQAIVGWCRHLAALGYVAVSINYRLGFLPTKGEVTRAGYAALQDAHAAMRYMVERRVEYGIDTNLLFVGGASAGGITALNLAFMRDSDRPSVVYSKRWRDMGTIASSGNSSKAHFHIKAVINMWGAMSELKLLKNSNTDIVSFHGDKDDIVPYNSGYPFNDVGSRVTKKLFDKMYGSMQINKYNRELGRRSILYTFPGEGHSLHHYSDGSWNQHNFEFIRDKMSEFLYGEIVSNETIIVNEPTNSRHYTLTGDVQQVAWQVTGGFINAMNGNDIWIVWCSDAEEHTLKATGRYSNGVGFEVTHKPNLEPKET